MDTLKKETQLKDLDPGLAGSIIDIVGEKGVPPDFGFQYYSVGLTPFLSVFDEEYLSSFIRQGGAGFRMVTGGFGGGKTHFLYHIRDLAWKNGFVVAFVPVQSADHPFLHLDLLYKEVAKSIEAPFSEDTERPVTDSGVGGLLRSWFRESEEKDPKDALHGLENISFARALNAAMDSLLDKREEDFHDLEKWLTGGSFDRNIHGKHGIFQPVGPQNAFSMLRSLIQWIREIGYSGLVILLDQPDGNPGVPGNKRKFYLDNMRQIIDACGHSDFQHVMIVHAGPKEDCYYEQTNLYEALRQRITPAFERSNPAGVLIDLDKTMEAPLFLSQLGEKLRFIFEVAFGHRFDEFSVRELISDMANVAYAHRFEKTGYKRLFVQNFIQGLHKLKKGSKPSPEDFRI